MLLSGPWTNQYISYSNMAVMDNVETNINVVNILGLTRPEIDPTTYRMGCRCSSHGNFIHGYHWSFANKSNMVWDSNPHFCHSKAEPLNYPGSPMQAIYLCLFSHVAQSIWDQSVQSATLLSPLISIYFKWSMYIDVYRTYLVVYIHTYIYA